MSRWCVRRRSLCSRDGFAARRRHFRPSSVPHGGARARARRSHGHTRERSVDRCIGVPGVELPPAARAFLAALDAAAIDADLQWLEASGAHIVPITSDGYPPLLAGISRAPPVLYVLGDIAALSSPQLAMVGSRNPTAADAAPRGISPRFFARAGLTITSGLALGIDAASHEGALGGRRPHLAVCGCGLGHVYPRQNARWPSASVSAARWCPNSRRAPSRCRAHFPQRNRIISGLALGTLVVEAARTQWLADHRATRARSGPRGVRRPRLDPQSAGARLPRIVPRGRQARARAPRTCCPTDEFPWGAVTCAAGRGARARPPTRRPRWTRITKCC